MRVTLALAIVLIGFGSVLSAQEPCANKRTLGVSGNGEVTVTPNEAEIRIGVDTEDPKLELAKSRNDKVVNSVVAAIQSTGIERKDIEIDQVSLDERSENREKLPPRKWFEASQRIGIVLRDLKKLDTLMALVVKSGANRIDAISFRNSELPEHRRRARTLAAQAARDKAKQLAADLGVRLGAIREVNDSGSESSALLHTPNAGLTNYQLSVNATEADGNGSQVTLGQIRVTASVSVIYDIE